jgi:ABC-type phosphonate transport system ATPase subunit
VDFVIVLVLHDQSLVRLESDEKKVMPRGKMIGSWGLSRVEAEERHQAAAAAPS